MRHLNCEQKHLLAEYRWLTENGESHDAAVKHLGVDPATLDRFIHWQKEEQHAQQRPVAVRA
jgi:hypothetical protein